MDRLSLKIVNSKKGKMKNKIKQLRTARLEKRLAKVEAAENVPRITNETVAEHREEVLKGARKYIYPLQHSKHKVVIITASIFVASVLGFLTFCVVSLYKVQSTSTFMYRVTQVLPFPVARSGKSFVSYESYLFELRHYLHYYEVQQKRDFNADSGNKQQLDDYKAKSLEKVINDSYIKKIAKENNISVSNIEVDGVIEQARRQNRLGGSSKSFEDSIKDYYGWTVNDFKRRIRTVLLEQKVAAYLDGDATIKARQVADALASGASFADVAKQYSEEDSTKQSGGEFGVIELSNTNLSPQTLDVLFKQKAGEVSQAFVVSYDTGYAYEIVKTIENSGDKAKGAHIIIRIKDINEFLNDKKESQPAKRYITL